MLGTYITIGILVAALLLVVFAALYPKLKQYRLTFRRLEPKKKRHTRLVRKKKKSVWIRVI